KRKSRRCGHRSWRPRNARRRLPATPDPLRPRQSGFTRASGGPRKMHGCARGPGGPVDTRNDRGKESSMAKKPFLTDIQTIRKRARQHLSRGAVTEGYSGDRNVVLKLLNEALAT